MREGGEFLVKQRRGADMPVRVNHALNLHVSRLDVTPLG